MAYFPNGSAGEVLDEQCSECAIPDDAPCPVLGLQLVYNYEQCNKGNEKLMEAMNLLIDEKGNCQMKIEIDKTIPDSYLAGEEHDTAKKMLDEMGLHSSD